MLTRAKRMPTPTPRDAHNFARAAEDFYSEPICVSQALFAVEQFHDEILDPCCGLGTIVTAAREAGHVAEGADIVDRGFPGTKVQDFFRRRSSAPNIVTNPPYALAKQIVEHALHTDVEKIAILFPIARVCAVKADWIYNAPLRRVWAIGPRPSIPPGQNILAGHKAQGGRVDFCWLVFEVDHTGPAEFDHLITRDAWRL
jgi:hypothetical protein